MSDQIELFYSAAEEKKPLKKAELSDILNEIRNQFGCNGNSELFEKNKRLIQLPYDHELDVDLPTYSFTSESLDLLIDRCGFRSFEEKKDEYLKLLNCQATSSVVKKQKKSL